MQNFKVQVQQTIQPFLDAYSELCDDLDLKNSKQLYHSVSTAFLHAIPETVQKLPKNLSARSVSKIIDVSLGNERGKSRRDAASLALHRLISLCRKGGLVDGVVSIRQRLRPEEVGVHDQQAFALLDDFIEVRTWLVTRLQKLPRSRDKFPELTIGLLISVNGICLNNAHLRLASCRTEHFFDQDGLVFLDVPKGRYRLKNPPPTIRYPLLPQMARFLSGVKRDGQWLFPKKFNPDTWRNSRRHGITMGKWLSELWLTVFGPDRPMPATWNMRNFIACSRLFLVLNSSPIIVAYLSARNTFSALLTTAISEENDVDDEGPDEEVKKVLPIVTAVEHARGNENHPLALEVIHAVKAIMGSVNHKVQSSGAKKRLANKIQIVAVAYEDLLVDFPVLTYLLKWMADQLDAGGNRRRMSGLRQQWQFIPTMLLEELVSENPTSLSKEEWEKLAEFLIQENNYSPDGQKKVKQHLKSFHNYLCSTHQEMQRLNWRRSELRVYSEQSGGMFPTLSEMDLLYAQAVREQDLQWRTMLMAALTLAFFGGLRVEEICLLSKMDIDNITIQLRVWWSKTRCGRRRLPLALLTPRKYMLSVLKLQQRCVTSKDFLFVTDRGEMVQPGTLGKRVKKLIKKTLPPERDMSIHTLRHGFASWLLVRYFVLHEPALLIAANQGGSTYIPDVDHIVFSATEQKKLVRVFNGRVAGEKYAEDPTSFLSKPEHFAYISRLIGHATRDTTARTYVHSMEWIAYYYLDKLKSEAIS